ncbi:MAG: c-type cytochrome [Dehalococcoidia bacterium]
MRKGANWAIVIGAAVVAGLGLLCIFAGLIALTGGFGWFTVSRGGPEAGRGFALRGSSLQAEPSGERPKGYSSNGELIYFTGTNEQGQRIPFNGGPMWLFMHGGSCASCHGPDGRGGALVMMGTKIPGNIRYHHLIEEEHEEGEEHPPYTDELIKRAITEGLKPAGEPLDWTMPRWRMSEEDLGDLLEFLKTLD